MNNLDFPMSEKIIGMALANLHNDTPHG